MRRFICCAIFTLGIFFTANGQVVINELTPRGTIADEAGDQQDWIEIYNDGAAPVNLSGYGLSDDALHTLKWKFPDITLDPGAYLFVLANGKDVVANIDHWESAVLSGNTWKYFIGASEPPANWNDIGFADGGWSSGTGGIGYGDGDDGTTIPLSTSVYLRKSFFVDDTSVIGQAKLHVDYDDGFVAYLNGVEIARSGNMIGIPPAYNTLASSDHEAGMYAGYPAELWDISEEIIQSLLVEGNNYFCLQVHNASAGSSDLSSNAWLSFGIKTEGDYFSPVPAWFTAAEIYNQTNFKISNTGETIYFSDPSGTILDSKYTGETALGQSIARKPDGAATWCITTDITPGASNNAATCYDGYEPDPIFSITSGFYTGTQTVSISSPSPTSEIRYTDDGSAVTETSALYASPLTVSASRVISAKCFSTGTLLPGKMSKQTYFINEDDYDLPVISISIDPGSLFDYDTGIYEFGCCYDGAYPYFGANFWQPWERFGHIEYFDTEGISQWTKDMALEIHGGWSRAEDQRSFRIDFKNEYDGELDYPLFPDKPEIGPINNFNLRNGGQHVWTYKFQDAFLAQVMKKTHIDYEAYQPCAVFINGNYWGWYEIREKADEHFAESNYGVNNNDVDVLNAWTVLNGSDTGLINLYIYANIYDPASDEFYNKITQYIDVENYVDYYAGEIYYQNVDFGGYYWGANNLKTWRDRNGGKFRFIMYDMDGAMGYFGALPSENYIDLTRAPSYPNVYSDIFNRFLYNPALRDYFVNRFADLINTVFMNENMETVIYGMKDVIESEIPRQVARWGGPDEPTVDYYLDYVLNYNATRHYTARNHINSSFDLNGQRTVTLAVEPAGAGYIHLNTITPTELPWSGVYFDGVPVTMTVIANPGFTFDHWEENDLIPTGSEENSLTINMDESATFTAVFTGIAASPEIVVTEINYNSNGSYEAGDWVEIYNNSDEEINLSEWKMKDNIPADEFLIPFETILSPGEYLVIAENPGLFNTIYPGVTNMTGGFSFNFDNSGDVIRLQNITGDEFLMLAYADSLPWPRGADGTGRTLELISPDADMNDPASWFDGCILGSPGTAYTPCNDDIVFGEINYRSAAASDAGDWVEIWNTTGTSIDISGWKFIDDQDTLLYQFAEGTLLNADERFVIANDLSKFASRHEEITNYTGPFLFGLDGGGEELRLIDENGLMRFTVIYDDDMPWPAEADGGGKTLELLAAGGKMNNAENWFAGCPEGSPTVIYDPDCFNAIIDETVLDFIVYPNPASTIVTVEIDLSSPEDISLLLTDQSGKVITVMNTITAPVIELKRGELASGIYWVKIISGEHVAMKMVVFM